MARPAFLVGPKLPRLARLLGVPIAEALGLCEFLWQAQYAKATEVVGDVIDAEINARWEGEPGRCVAAMLDDGVRLLDRAAGGVLSVHDFWDHAPDYVKERRKTELKRRAAGVTLSEIRAANGRLGAAVTNARRGKPSANPDAVADCNAASTPALADPVADAAQESGKPAANRRPPLPFPTLNGSSTKILPSPDGEGTDALPPKAPRRAPYSGAIGAFCRAWEARYPELAPACPTADDCKAVNAALRRFPPEERERIAEAYVADDELWLVTNAHRLGLLPKKLDALRRSLASPRAAVRDRSSGSALVGAHPASKEGPPSPPREFPPAPDGGGVWPAILERLRGVVDERDFDTWLRGTRQSGELNGALRVVVASDLFVEYVAREYGAAITEAASNLGVNAPIEYVTGR